MLSYYLYAILISGHFKLSGKAKTSRAPTDLAEDPRLYVMTELERDGLVHSH